MNENMSKNQHIISMCIAFFSCTNIIKKDMVCDWKMKDAISRVSFVHAMTMKAYVMFDVIIYVH